MNAPDTGSPTAAPVSAIAALTYPVATAALMVSGMLIFLQILAVGVIQIGGMVPRFFGAPLAGTIGEIAVSAIGYLVHVVIWICLYRYGFEVLFLSANGRRQPPEVVGLVEGEVANRHVWLQIALMFACVIVARHAGTSMGLIVAVALGALMPAAAITLTVTQSLVAAINPLQWGRALGVLGPRYVAPMLVAMIMAPLTTFAIDWMPKTEPYVAGVIIYYASAHFVVMLGFHLMGLALHAEAARLHFQVDAKTLPAHRLRVDEDPILRRAELLARGHDLAAAAALLEDALKHGGGIAMHHRYREYLTRLGDRDRLRAHSSTFITLLRATHGDRPALKLLLDCRSEDSTFLPTEVEDSTALIISLAKSGNNAAALSAFADLQNSIPRSTKTMLCALTLAQEFLFKNQRIEDAIRLSQQAKQTAKSTNCSSPEILSLIDAVEEQLAKNRGESNESEG